MQGFSRVDLPPVKTESTDGARVLGTGSGGGSWGWGRLRGGMLRYKSPIFYSMKAI